MSNLTCVPVMDKCFVYGTAKAPPSAQPVHKTANDQSAIPGPTTEFVDALKSKVNTLSQNPEWLPWLSGENRLLLDYFVTRLTPKLALHARIGEAYCHTLMPMALDTSRGFHLLASVLVLAAIHRRLLGLFDDEAHLMRLQSTCVQDLRHQVIGLDPVVDDIFAATALTLCVGEIMNGESKTGTWKLHLKGATAVLSRFKTRPSSPRYSNVSGRQLLLRWCRTLEVLALFTGNSAQPTLGYDSGSSTTSKDVDYIDGFDGFSTTLYDIFHDINVLANEQTALQSLKHHDSNDGFATELLQTSLLARCGKLAHQIQDMTANRARRLEPFIDAHTSSELKADFDALNESYHHAALLEIYQRIMHKSPADPAVQHSVKAGIRSLQRITQFEEASPAIASLRCIFTIGGSAIEVLDRAFVVGWLARMKYQFSMGNVDTVSAFLLELWLRNDALQLEGKGAVLQWTTLVGKWIQPRFFGFRIMD